MSPGGRVYMTGHQMAVREPSRRRSLVDGAEEALSNWLASGHRRPGEHLPPEHELATMLGISRGTLRSALRRLEQRGEIVRRQGSGTFVGRVARHTALVEGLERLESYSSLARRHGLTLRHRDLHLEYREVGPELGEVFGLAADAVAPRISRVVTVNDRPNAIMIDVVHPDVPLPPIDEIDRSLTEGRMILDILVEHGMPIAFSSTSIRPVLIGPKEQAGRLLEVTETTAALELEETVHLTTGEAIQRSVDLFGPGGLDLHVIRALKTDAPGHIGPVGDGPPSDEGSRRSVRARRR
jgi:GntR family transcriptional regulator